MIILATLVSLCIFIIIRMLNKRRFNLYKKTYTMINKICDNILLKIVNMKKLEETKDIDKLIEKNIKELKHEVKKISINNYPNIEEKAVITSMLSYLEELSLELDNISILENNHENTLNDLSYKVWNLKNKYTTNNVYKPIRNQVKINSIVDSLYYLRDDLNNIYIRK